MEGDVLAALRRSATDLRTIIDEVSVRPASWETDFAALRRLDVVATGLVQAVRRHAEHVAATAHETSAGQDPSGGGEDGDDAQGVAPRPEPGLDG